MSKYKTVEDLDLSYSKSQLYRRIKRLIGQNIISPKRGARGQYLLSPGEINLLRRLRELEDSYKGVESAIVQLENEQLRERVNQLENKNQSLKNELVARNNIIQRLRGQWFDRLREGLKGVISWFK